jgi:hypothetical protein
MPLLGGRRAQGVVGAAALGLLAGAAASAFAGRARAAAGAVPAAVMNQARPLTTDDLDAFVGPLIEEPLHAGAIGGAVVVVVKDGATLFARGYGRADVEPARPMTADATLVRPGSISKLFTGIAVMQLVVVAAVAALHVAGKADTALLSDALDPALVALYAVAWQGVLGGAVAAFIRRAPGGCGATASASVCVHRCWWRRRLRWPGSSSPGASPASR